MASTAQSAIVLVAISMPSLADILSIACHFPYQWGQGNHLESPRQNKAKFWIGTGPVMCVWWCAMNATRFHLYQDGDTMKHEKRTAKFGTWTVMCVCDDLRWMQQCSVCIMITTTKHEDSCMIAFSCEPAANSVMTSLAPAAVATHLISKAQHVTKTEVPS